MSKEAPKKEEELSADVRDTANKIAEGLTVNIEEKKIIPADGAFFIGADEDLREAVDKVLDRINLMTKAASLAVGEASIPAFKDNGELDQLTAEFPIRKKGASLQILVQRERTSNVPKTDRTVTTYAAITPKVELYCTRPRGELSRIKSMISNMATEAYGNSK